MPGAEHPDHAADLAADHADESLGRIASVRVRLLPRPRDRALVDELLGAIRSGRWSPNPGFVKRDKGRWVWLGAFRVADGELGLVIKGRRRPRLGWLPDRHAIRQAIGAARLVRIGVPTSEPIALLDVNTTAGDRQRWLVLRAIPGESLAHVIAQGGMSFDAESALARRAGALVRTLGDAGLFNRDHKASNLIVSASGELGIVDTVAIRRRRPGGPSRRRMLLAMCKELSGIGAMPRRAALLRCLRSASDDVRADWRAIGALRRSAGDTTPRVDPLVRG
jgi:hypothetical protein